MGSGAFDAGGGNIHAVRGGGASALAADGRGRRSTKKRAAQASKPALKQQLAAVQLAAV